MSFQSPLAEPASWTLSSSAVVIPGLRYQVYPARALVALRTGGTGEVRAPSVGVIRRMTVPANGSEPSFELVELQPLAFHFRRLAQLISAGVPTFYFLFPAGTVIGAVDHEVVKAGDVLATLATDGSRVRLVTVFPDRLVREPVLAARMLLAAMVAVGEGAIQWTPFVDALETQTTGKADTPVLLLDHTGAPVSTGTVELHVGEAIHPVTFTPADNGDLQAAIARLKMENAIPLSNLWGGGATSATIRPVGGDVQLALLDDLLFDTSEIEISPSGRHVLLTDLHSWFAPQTVTSKVGPLLERYSRRNHLTPLVNGIEYYADLFARLNEARGSELGGFHLSGWSMYHDTPLTRAPAGAPENFPLTLMQAATLIKEAGGGSRFLVAQFLQLDESERDKLKALEVLALYALVSIHTVGELVRGPFDLDATGVILGLAALLAKDTLTNHLLGKDWKKLEQNNDAVTELKDNQEQIVARFSPSPLTVDDNPLLDDGRGVIGLGTLFEHIRHFNLFHQKLALVRRAAGVVGYCGGIDCNPDRLDDARHLLAAPFHDVHAKLEGPAVRDLIITFDERWKRDGKDTEAAFTLEQVSPIADAGYHVVQVARTYGAAKDPSRALEFAPEGDRTLLNTMLLAIGKAREFIYIEDQYLAPPEEYVEVLVDKVASGTLRKLIISIPALTDQPFGEIRRTEVIERLRKAAETAGKDIVRIGSPRRRFTIPTATLRGSSGRLILRNSISEDSFVIELGPLERLPEVPFWLSIDGELMWVYDESPPLGPNDNKRSFKVERGDETQLLSGLGTGKGGSPRAHQAGTAATVVKLDGIYVHAKMMIVDDVFLSVGSANLNRRGCYSDGECNLFMLPERLRADPANPVRALRKRLWAEMLDLPLGIADPLLEDPVASSALFERSYFLGNRYVQAEALPKHVMTHNFAGGDGLGTTILNHLGAGILVQLQPAIFDLIVDPTTKADLKAP